MLSGIGKTALFGAGVLGELAFSKKDQHPYIAAMALIVVTTWDVADLVYLYRDVDHQNAKRRASLTLPIALLPSLSMSRDSVHITLGASF